MSTMTATAKKPPRKPQKPPRAMIQTASTQGEHQLFTTLLDAIRPIAIETTLLLDGEETYGTLRLFDLLRLYTEGEFTREVAQRRDDQDALAAILEPQKRGRLRIVQSHQAVLRFYGWLAENGFVSRGEYEQVLSLAKGTIGSVLA